MEVRSNFIKSVRIYKLRAKNCLYFIKKLATHEGDKIFCINSPSKFDTNLELIKN